MLVPKTILRTDELAVIEKLHPQVQQEVVRQQELMGWPDMVPAYVELPDAMGQVRMKCFHDLNVSDCEQATEFYLRRARRAYATFLKTGTKNACTRAGKNLLYARLYRCEYIGKLGIEDSTEADMPQILEPDDEP